MSIAGPSTVAPETAMQRAEQLLRKGTLTASSYLAAERCGSVFAIRCKSFRWS